DRFEAVKIAFPTVTDKDAAARFQREGKALAAVEHANVCRVYGADITADGRPYLAMEYVEGPTLRAWAGDNRRSFSELARLMAGLAEGLARAHGRGITRRDTSPATTLVRPGAGAVVFVLVDLGFARPLEEMPAGSLGAVVGTPGSLSPEQAEGKPADTRSDI